MLQIIYFSDDGEPRAKQRKETTMTEKIIDNFRVHLGVSTFMDYDMKGQLTKFFTPESIKLPVLYDVYCNPEDIPWEIWGGKLDDLLTDKKLQRDLDRI